MTALANLLAVLAIVAAYRLGRWHQAQKDAQAWSTYGEWLRQQRERVKGRFLDIRV